jgi:hypothetical protein
MHPGPSRVHRTRFCLHIKFYNYLYWYAIKVRLNPWQRLNLPATRPLAPSLSPVGNGGEGARRAGEEVRLLVYGILNAIQY